MVICLNRIPCFVIISLPHIPTLWPCKPKSIIKIHTFYSLLENSVMEFYYCVLLYLNIFEQLTNISVAVLKAVICFMTSAFSSRVLFDINQSQIS